MVRNAAVISYLVLCQLLACIGVVQLAIPFVQERDPLRDDPLFL